MIKNDSVNPSNLFRSCKLPEFSFKEESKSRATESRQLRAGNVVPLPLFVVLTVGPSLLLLLLLLSLVDLGFPNSFGEACKLWRDFASDPSLQETSIPLTASAFFFFYCPPSPIPSLLPRLVHPSLYMPLPPSYFGVCAECA